MLLILVGLIFNRINLQLKNALLHWPHFKAMINLYYYTILNLPASSSPVFKGINKQRVSTCKLLSMEKLINSDLQYIWFFSRWFAFSKNQECQKWFSRFGKLNVMNKCSVKCRSQMKPETKECADDKLKESFSKET